MRRILLSASLLFLFSPDLQAAPPLAPGQIVVAGFTYAFLPPGACSDRLCTVDAALTTLTPISAPLPADSHVLDLAIENPSSIVVLVSVPDLPRPSTGTIFHVDVATGAVTTLASGLPIAGDASIATGPGGRIFVNGNAGILEVDRGSGAASVLAPGVFVGVDTENGRMSLVTAENCEEFFCDFTFVRIDLATGAATPLGPANDLVRKIDVRPSGDLLVFTSGGYFLDGLTYVWSPGAQNFWVNEGETWQAMTRGIAADLDGNALVAAADGVIDGFDELELTRFSATGFHQVLAVLHTDVGLSAIDVTPVFTRCSNGIDDDGDGAMDFPDDPGCGTPLALKEAPRCNDGVDNDGDGGIDWDGGGTGSPPDLECAGIASRDREVVNSGGCGLGAELVLVLAVLRRLRT
jgi:hypothetical protein